MWPNKLIHLPFTYNIRSLLVRKGSSLFTLASIALTVMVFTIMAGLTQGLESTYTSRGREDVLIALSKGSNSAEISQLPKDSLFILKYHPAIKQRVDGSPFFSEEVYLIKPLLPLREMGAARWLPLRGVHPKNLDLYPQISLIEGRSISAPGEIMIGKLVSTKLGKIEIGDSLELGRQTHRVVGIFSAQGTAYESELWLLNSDLLIDYDISEQSIAVFAIAKNQSPDLAAREMAQDPRLQVDVKTEKAYFSDMSENYAFVTIIGGIIAAIMSVGAVFAGMNTMYASVSSRIREIGTLRAMGFSRKAIQLSFLLESLFLGLSSGLLGAIGAFLMNGISLSFMRSALNIEITFSIALQGIALGLFVGFLGGYPPARNASQMKIVDVINA